MGNASKIVESSKVEKQIDYLIFESPCRAMNTNLSSWRLEDQSGDVLCI
jgi:hypothetical protein